MTDQDTSPKAAEADLTDLAQKSTRLITQLEAERDALRALLAEAVDTANQAIDVIASVQNDPWEENALTMCEHEVFDFDVETARAFIARAAGKKP